MFVLILAFSVGHLLSADVTSAPESATETKDWKKMYEEEEKEFNKTVKELTKQVGETENTCISLMLLMSVTFMMANFYLVNHPDEDIKIKSWQVISSTISIFSSVLIFQALDGCLEAYVYIYLTEWQEILVDYAHMFFWITMVQLTLAFNTGAMCPRRRIKKIEQLKVMHAVRLRDARSRRATAQELEDIHEHDLKELHEAKEPIELDTKSWAILLGHIGGFAAINAFGNMQQVAAEWKWTLGQVAAWALGVAAFAFLALVLFFLVTNLIREKVSGLDGKVDEWEELWDEETEETENDVIALAVSWLVVQGIRALIVKALPNEEGVDSDDAVISDHCFLYLLLCGLGAALLGILKSICWKSAKEGEEKGPPTFLVRCNKWLQDVLAMIMSWSFLFGVSLFLQKRLPGAEDEESSLLTVTNAMLTSMLAIGLIFVLDKLADADWTDDEVDATLRSFMDSFGILIGFAWERSFDVAVGGIAEQNTKRLPAPLTKLLLAIVLAGIVVPAWKFYILKQALAVAKKERAEEEEETSLSEDVELSEWTQERETTPLRQKSGEQGPRTLAVKAR